MFINLDMFLSGLLFIEINVAYNVFSDHYVSYVNWYLTSLSFFCIIWIKKSVFSALTTLFIEKRNLRNQ